MLLAAWAEPWITGQAGSLAKGRFRGSLKITPMLRHCIDSKWGIATAGGLEGLSIGRKAPKAVAGQITERS
jgi:hypothetical protein